MKSAAVLFSLIAAVLLSIGGAGTGVDVVPFDSGTRVVREVAEALNGTGRSILEAYPRGSEIFLGLISLLPERARIATIEWGMGLSVGTDADRASEVSIDDLAVWCVSQYPNPTAQYPAIVIGSPNGAVAHLAALLGAPFLTTSFGLAFAHETIDPDDLDAYLASGVRAAECILAANDGRDVEIVCHYDPIHDRSMVKVAAFLRIKLLELPDAYERFIDRHLEPGGRLILVDCAYEWPQVSLQEKLFLQVGGLGAIRPETYLERVPDAATTLRRESEWGCPAPFAEAVRAYASERGESFLEARFDHPSGYSELAYEAYLLSRDVRSEMVLLDTFNHQNPRTNVEVGIPALWLPFNTADALAFARDALAGRKFDKILFAPLPSFAGAEDTVLLDSWADELAAFGPVEILGGRRDGSPADPLGPFRLARELGDLRRDLTLEEPLHLSVEDLESLLAQRPDPCE